MLMIEFDFEREFLVGKLKDHGKAIRELKFEKSKNIKKEIEEYLDSNPKELITPLSAYITFEHSKAVNLMKELNKKDGTVQVEEAQFPSNIKHERR